MRDAPETRHSLIAKLCGNQNDTAWSEFANLYEPAIYRYARRQGLQDADACEVVQEVLLNVRTLALNPVHARKEKFRAWLASVTRNRVIDLVRKKSRKERVISELAMQYAPSDDSLQNEVRHQMFKLASVSVQQKVSSIQWQAFWKTAVELIPPKEVAEQLQMSIGNVYVSRCRVMEKLRIEIERMTHDESNYEGRSW